MPLQSAGPGALTRRTSRSEASGATCTALSTGPARQSTFTLSAKRDVAAAKAFFRKAIKSQRVRLRRLRWIGTRPRIARCAS